MLYIITPTHDKWLSLQQYTEALLILFNLIAKQQRDLKSTSKRHSLGIAALAVKKIAPSVNKCCQTCVKYPHNSQATVSAVLVYSLHCVESLFVVRLCST